MMISPFIPLRITLRNVDLLVIVLDVSEFFFSVKDKLTVQNVEVKSF